MLVLTRRAFFGTGALLLGRRLSAQASSLSVLFIGNSYTYYNDLPTMLTELAVSMPGPLVRSTMITAGGMTLQWHYASGKATAAIDGGDWDYVILQEQSALGGELASGQSRVTTPAAFFESVRRFVERIRLTRAAPLLFMTWARRDRPQDQLVLADAYRTIGQELMVPVAPVGMAWAEARRRWPDLELHVEDGSHPNPTGSYLAACVLYVSLTGRDPRGAALPASVSPVVAPRLQELAYTMARAW